jgi:hypothetical protein
MYIVPDNATGVCEVRLRINSLGACTTAIVSRTIPFTVRADKIGFDYYHQPPPRANVCIGDTLEFFVSYYGIIDTTKSY